MNKVVYLFLAIAIIAGTARFLVPPPSPVSMEVVAPGEINCPEVEMICPDGSYAERQGMSCGYTCPPEVSAEIQAMINAKSDQVTLRVPLPNEEIESPLHIAGNARGNWFFEASFPVVLTNWDGLIIAEGVAAAEGDWMTTEFVPFTASLTFVNPFKSGNPDFMQRGTLILKKDNPSGLPEHEGALEIPIRFAP
jgi:hypothetical protein